MQELHDRPHPEKRYKAVVKALRFLMENPRHPSLQTHPYSALKGNDGEKVFEAYAEQNTPAAYRIFFHYGKTKGEIVILAITPHP
ncbi:MAG TPA: hypothetical protein P5511_00930 [Candidatus Goldiibacteriota bacterium]|nr:hypothetical protein [Candidatus Goldiibacteriota bacterium]